MYQISCEDAIIHTAQSPVCSDASCPCHEQSFAQGECPKCGHDWTAHSAWIANPGDTTCEEAEWSDIDDAFLLTVEQERVAHEFYMEQERIYGSK